MKILKYKFNIGRRKFFVGLFLLSLLGLFAFNQAASQWVYSSGYQMLAEYLDSSYGIKIQSERKMLKWTISSPVILLESTKIKVSAQSLVSEIHVDSVSVAPDLRQLLTSFALGIGSVEIKGLKTRIVIPKKSKPQETQIKNFSEEIPNRTQIIDAVNTVFDSIRYVFGTHSNPDIRISDIEIELESEGKISLITISNMSLLSRSSSEADLRIQINSGTVDFSLVSTLSIKKRPNIQIHELAIRTKVGQSKISGSANRNSFALDVAFDIKSLSSLNRDLIKTFPGVIPDLASNTEIKVEADKIIGNLSMKNHWKSVQKAKNTGQWEFPQGNVVSSRLSLKFDGQPKIETEKVDLIFSKSKLIVKSDAGSYGLIPATDIYAELIEWPTNPQVNARLKTDSTCSKIFSGLEELKNISKPMVNFRKYKPKCKLTAEASTSFSLAKLFGTVGANDPKRLDRKRDHNPSNRKKSKSIGKSIARDVLDTLKIKGEISAGLISFSDYTFDSIESGKFKIENRNLKMGNLSSQFKGNQLKVDLNYKRLYSKKPRLSIRYKGKIEVGRFLNSASAGEYRKTGSGTASAFGKIEIGKKAPWNIDKFTFSTDLQGVESNLPKPFNKTRKESTLLTSLIIQDEKGFVGNGQFDQSDWRFILSPSGEFRKFQFSSPKTNWSISDNGAGIAVEGKIEKFNISLWTDFYDSYIKKPDSKNSKTKKLKSAPTKPTSKSEVDDLLKLKIADIPIVNLEISKVIYRKQDMGSLIVKSSRQLNVMTVEKLSLKGPLFINVNGKIKVGTKASIDLSGHYSIHSLLDLKGILPLEKDELAGQIAGNLKVEGEAKNLLQLVDEADITLSSKIQDLCYKSSRKEIAIFVNALLLNIVDFFSQKICFETGTAVLSLSKDNIGLNDVYLSGESLYLKANGTYHKEKEVVDSEVFITPNYGKNLKVMNVLVAGANPILGVIVSKLVTPIINGTLQSATKIKYTIKGKISDPEVEFSL